MSLKDIDGALRGQIKAMKDEGKKTKEVIVFVKETYGKDINSGDVWWIVNYHRWLR